MIDGRRVLIIVPAWNEAESIRAVVREIAEVLPGADVLVVDDGGTDDTARIAREAGAIDLGVGGAMRLGYRYARDGGYDAAVQIDADGQHDPKYVPALLDGLGDASLVIGARFAGEGEYRVGRLRQLAMFVLSFTLSRMAGRRLTDTTSGFRACDRALIEFFAQWYPVDYLGDTVETLVRVIRLGYQVSQIPTAMRPRAGGVPSKSAAKALIYLSRAVITLVLAVGRR